MLLLLPLWAVGAIPRLCWRDRVLSVVLVVAGLLLAWMATLQMVRDSAIPSGWWRIGERAGALVLFLYAACSLAGSRQILTLLGAASAITAVVVLMMNRVNGIGGSMQPATYAYGHVNIFANTIGPALWAWWALLLSDRAERRGGLPLILAALGTMAYGAIAIDTGRRGAALGLLAGAAFVSWLWLWRRHRTMAVGLALSGVVVAMTLALRLFADPVPSLRNERIALYRAGWETALQGLPWGHGHYGALQVQHVGTEAARHLTATGTWVTHIHNEPLDVLIDGGPVALALVAILAALTLARTTRITDPALRRSAQVLLAAISAHLLTDNVFGTEVGQVFLGLAAGIVWGCPARFSSWQPWLQRHWPPAAISARWIAWPLVLMSAAVATRAIYPAVLHAEAYPSIHVQCLRQALDPTSVQLRAVFALMSAQPPMDQESRRNTIDWAVAKMGWTPPLAAADAQYWLDQGDAAGSVAALVRLLGLNPFSKLVHANLDATLRAHPESQLQLSPSVMRRLAWLSGSAAVAAPPLKTLDCADINAAADAYAVITRAIVLGAAWTEISQPLEQLVRRYGDIPDVTTLALRCAIAAPEGSFPWLLAQAETLRVGQRFLRDTPALLAEVAIPAQARAVAPVLATLNASLWMDWDQGRTGLAQGAEATPEWLALVRVHGLAKRAGFPPLTASR